MGNGTPYSIEKIEEELNRKQDNINKRKRDIEEGRQLFTTERNQLRKTQEILEAPTYRIQREERQQQEIIELEEREEVHRQQRQRNKLRKEYETEYGIKFESEEEFNEYLEMLELEDKPLEDYPRFQHYRIYKPEQNNDEHFFRNINIGPSQPLTLKQLSLQIVKENIESPIIQSQLQIPENNYVLSNIVNNEDDNLNRVKYDPLYKQVVTYVNLISIQHGTNRYISKILSYADISLLPIDEDNSHIIKSNFNSLHAIFNTTQTIIEANLYAIHNGKLISLPRVIDYDNLSISISFYQSDIFKVEIYYHNNQVQTFIIH